MGLEFEYEAGQTPIDENEREGLRIDSISTMVELNEFEQQNIEEAIQWTMLKKRTVEEILSEKFVCELHRRMFGNVWEWAGAFRKTEKNLGVKSYLISVELRQLLDDCLFWIKNKSYPEEEIAVRLKHRIVAVHCFSNGNGRHSRLLADVLMQNAFRRPVFTWGASVLSKDNEPRKKYLKAVKLADKGDIAPLLAFAKS